LIPIIDALNKERGSKNKVYSAIAFGALALALIVVIYRIFSGAAFRCKNSGDTKFCQVSTGPGRYKNR